MKWQNHVSKGKVDPQGLKNIVFLVLDGHRESKPEDHRQKSLIFDRTQEYENKVFLMSRGNRRLS